ncbi:MAG: hypothetical protein J3R72DRAFT_348130, partial [Linnemannia gamsii]
QVYDLKGSRRNRFVQPSGRENEVLLDENFIEYMSESDDKQELLVGIVDFIRPFTWDKKLESWVKDAVGSKEPTIVSPAQYRKRFRIAMNRHLNMVPDRW